MSFLGYPPGNLHEYQKKRLTKFAFRKCMIPKGMFFAEQNGKRGKKFLEKKKAGPWPRTLNAVTYEIKYSRD